MKNSAEKIVIQRPLKEWGGFRDDDEMVEYDPDRIIIKRGGELLIFSDTPIIVTD